jgi:magnesium chelatase family protein
LTAAEAIEVSMVHSVAGLLEPGRGLLHERPFRAPHHSISRAGLIGGGSWPRPGEVALAHRGVLFLDEMAEFERGALEALRQPLELGSVGITRRMRSIRFPAQFQLVGAMNPCRCGHFFSGARCRCSFSEVSRYQSKVSGPLLDRIDIQVIVEPVSIADLHAEGAPPEGSVDVRGRLEAARQRQHHRYGPGRTNADLAGSEVRREVPLERSNRRLLANAYSEFGLSARAHDRILKISRTIADLAGSDRVEREHLLEAIQFRKLDRTIA